MIYMSAERAATIELSLPSELGYEKLVRQMVVWLAQRLEVAAATIANIQTALSEACINAIEHGNQALARLRVGVAMTVTPEYFEAIVSDAGISPFCPPEQPPASMEQKLAGLAPARGMGLMLIHQLVDEAGFLACEPGEGNRFRMRIYWRPEPVPAS